MAANERVLIAGAGPVGLVAAASLGKAGVPVLVMEAGDELAPDLRASTFHPPTLDMLDEFGVTEKLIEQGLIAPQWQFRDRQSGDRAEFDLSILSDVTNHPYRVQCEQHKLTRIIYPLLQEMDNVDVVFGTRVTGVSQTADEAVAITERNGEEVRYTGAYLIGADGASSVVRIDLGIGFEGITYPEDFVQASTTFEFREHIPNMSLINYISDAAEWYVLLRVPGLWRVLFPTRNGESEEEAISEEGLQRRLQGVVPRDEPYEIAHRTLYHVHQRVATTYNQGRIFLVGDAAHLNNPLGGMGMNGGIHDALNLTSKLLRVRDGEDVALFDAYTRERQPIAVEYVQAQAERNRQLLRERDEAVRMAGFRDLQATAADPARARKFLLRSSMIDSLQKAEAAS